MLISKLMPQNLVQRGNAINGGLSVISSDPPCKDGSSRFTTVPLIALSDQIYKFDINVYNTLNW